MKIIPIVYETEELNTEDTFLCFEAYKTGMTIKPNSLLAVQGLWGWTTDRQVGDKFDVYVQLGDENITEDEAQRYLKSAYTTRLEEVSPGSTPREYYFEGFNAHQGPDCMVYGMDTGT